MLLALILLSAVLLFGAIPASAATPEEYWEELSGILPSLSGDLLPATDAASLGEAVGVRYLFEVIAEGVGSHTGELVGTLLLVGGITLLFALLSALGQGLGGGTVRVAEAILGVMLMLTVYERTEGCFARATAYLADLSTLAELAAPLMSGLYLAGGNTATAAVGGGAMAATTLVLEYLMGAALMPLLRIMLGFLLVSAIGEIRTEGVSTALRNLYVTVLGLFSALIAAALALGSVLGAAQDSLTLRSLRFAVGQMLPVVGGTVSSSLGAAMASLSLIRGTAGVGVAATALLPLLPLVAELVLVRLSLSLLSAFAAALGAAAPVRLLRAYRALLDLVLAAVAMAGLLFIFLGAMLARCAPAVGV